MNHICLFSSRSISRPFVHWVWKEEHNLEGRTCIVKQYHAHNKVNAQFCTRFRAIVLYIFYFTKYCIVEKEGKKENQLFKIKACIKRYCWSPGYIVSAYNLVPTLKDKNPGFSKIFFFFSFFLFFLTEHHSYVKFGCILMIHISFIPIHKNHT